MSPSSLLTPASLEELIQLRQTVHRYPELSGQEAQTAQRLQQFVTRYDPDQVITGLGGHGLAVVYTGSQPGPTILIRADMDGLPIQETGDWDYCSCIPSTAHLCGHDGHLTMVAGLAAWLHQQPLQRGRVILLFQPAEETGAGAAQVIASDRFADLRPDYVFALHNLPRYPLGQVVLRTGTFAAASKGMIIRLQGTPSHAAHPEHGRSPALAMARLVQEITALGQNSDRYQDFVLTTVVHARLGEIAFGTAPGEAEVMATLRSYRDEDMALLTATVEELAQEVAQAEGLTVTWEWTDVFPATVNQREATAMVKAAAIARGLDWLEAPDPFRWSEDFGYFTQSTCGAMFGLGAGSHHPQLHNADYDFPDSLIPYGVELFAQLITDLLG